MIGTIAGDTIGSAYEFSNTKDYNFRLFTSESDFTDDSIMTAAVAAWLLRDPAQSHQGLEDAMLEFANTCPCPMGGYGTEFWTWLFNPSHIRPYEACYGASPYVSRTGRRPYGSWGNGSAMRVSPVGWFFDSLEETERVAKISAEVTHNHPEGVKGAQATAAAVFLARTGKSREDIRDYVEKRFGYDLHRSWAYWHPLYDWDSSCQGTVPQALICFLESTDFEDAIRKAVSLGGDSDTLACITGGVAEAFYGGIPDHIAARILRGLPDAMLDTLSQMRLRTPYGELYPGQ